MKLSTKSTYGLRAMLNIALNGSGEPRPITGIARTEGISQQYLEQLLNKLKKENLVKSVRGPKGGYLLSRRPRQITVRDIVKALEGEIAPVHCMATSLRAPATCKKMNGCVPKIVWNKLAEAISDCLGSITLNDLCAEAKKVSGYVVEGRVV